MTLNDLKKELEQLVSSNTELLKRMFSIISRSEYSKHKQSDINTLFRQLSDYRKTDVAELDEKNYRRRERITNSVYRMIDEIGEIELSEYNKFFKQQKEKAYQILRENNDEYIKDNYKIDYIDRRYTNSLTKKTVEWKHVLSQNDKKLIYILGEAGCGKSRMCIRLIEILNNDQKKLLYLLGDKINIPNLISWDVCKLYLEKKLNKRADSNSLDITLELFDLDFIIIDGFDEINDLNSSNVEDILHTIDELSKELRNVEMKNGVKSPLLIITSRPGYFTRPGKHSSTYNLLSLNIEEQINFVKAFKEENYTRSYLVKAFVDQLSIVNTYQSFFQNPALLYLILNTDLCSKHDLEKDNRALLCSLILEEKYKIDIRPKNIKIIDVTTNDIKEWKANMKALAKRIHPNNNFISNEHLKTFSQRNSIKFDLSKHLTKKVKKVGSPGFEIRPKLLYEYLIAEEFLEAVDDSLLSKENNNTQLIQSIQLRVGKTTFSDETWRFIKELIYSDRFKRVKRNYPQSSKELEEVFDTYFPISFVEKTTIKNLIQEICNTFYSFWRMYELCQKENPLKEEATKALFKWISFLRNNEKVFRLKVQNLIFDDSNSKVVFKNLSSVRFSSIKQRRESQNILFEQCNFRDSRLYSADINKITFRYCNLSNFTVCGQFKKVVFERCYTDNNESEKLLLAYLQVEESIEFVDCNFPYLKFKNRQPIKTVNFINTNLSNAVILISKFVKGKRSKIDLSFEYSNLSNAYIRVDGLTKQHLIKASNLKSISIEPEIEQAIAEDKRHGIKLGSDRLKELNPEHPKLKSISFQKKKEPNKPSSLSEKITKVDEDHRKAARFTLDD